MLTWRELAKAKRSLNKKGARETHSHAFLYLLRFADAALGRHSSNSALLLEGKGVKQAENVTPRPSYITGLYF